MENMYTEKEVKKLMHNCIKSELTSKYGFVQSLKKNQLVRVREHYLDIIWYDKAPSGTYYYMELHPLCSFFDGYFIIEDFLFPLAYFIDDPKFKEPWWKISIRDENYKDFFPIDEFEKVCENGIKPYLEHAIIPFFNSITFNDENSFDNFNSICKRGHTVNDYENSTIIGILSYCNPFDKIVLEYAVLFNKLILLTENKLNEFSGITCEIKNVIKSLIEEYDYCQTEHYPTEHYAKDIENLKSILTIFETKENGWENALKNKIAEIEIDFMQNFHGVTLDENGNTIKFKKPRKKRIIE